MTYMDKTLICGDCMNRFTFTREEQEIDALNEEPTRAPSRCPECRASRKALHAAREIAPVAVSRRRY